MIEGLPQHSLPVKRLQNLSDITTQQMIVVRTRYLLNPFQIATRVSIYPKAFDANI